jgi:hypothetical protein
VLLRDESKAGIQLLPAPYAAANRASRRTISGGSNQLTTAYPPASWKAKRITLCLGQRVILLVELIGKHHLGEIRKLSSK